MNCEAIYLSLEDEDDIDELDDFLLL